MKMCEQIFKKRQRPNTIQILWIVKHTRQIAGKQPPLIPISMIGIERTEDIEKKRFL